MLLPSSLLFSSLQHLLSFTNGVNLAVHANAQAHGEKREVAVEEEEEEEEEEPVEIVDEGERRRGSSKRGT